MKECLVVFKTAKLAEKKGFPQNICYNLYLEDGKTMTDNHYKSKLNEKLKSSVIGAPTQSLLQKWLRDKYNIHVVPIYISKGDGYEIRVANQHKFGKQYFKEDGLDIWTFEQALETGLQEALKLIK